MSQLIGLNVIEVDGSATPALAGAATSVAGFNIVTARGVPNRPTRVTSFQQFVDGFGSYLPDGYGAYLVKGFFENGGVTAWVNRVVGTGPDTGAVPASTILEDEGGQATLELQAGQLGQKDPGQWANELLLRVGPAANPRSSRLREVKPASLRGGSLAETVDMTAFLPLTLVVDGEPFPTVLTFAAAHFADPTRATPAEIRDAINGQTSKVVASLDADRLVVASTGAVARLRDGPTRLALTAANGPLAFDAPVPEAVGTPAEPATGGAVLAHADRFVPGDAVRVSDGVNEANTKILSIDPATGAVTWAPPVAGIETWDALSFTVRKAEFDLTLSRAREEDVVERWTHLAMEPELPNYAVTVLNDPVAGSRFLFAIDRSSPSGAGGRVPAPTAGFTRMATFGRNGTPTAQDFVGDGAAHTGFHAFDPVGVQLLACERTDPGVVSGGIDYCSARGDCMYVGAVPVGTVGTPAAVAYGQALQGRKVYGALYGPWIWVLDPAQQSASPRKLIPPTGHVMGVYARIEATRGVWKAPAGDEAVLLGVLDVEHRLSDADHDDLVRNGSVNGIRAVPRAGVVVDASRTLSTDTRWLYVNVRLLFNYVKSSLKQGLRWVRQEPNREALWKAIKFGTVTPFLMGLWRQGAFGAGTPDQVFSVVCDASNNPPEQVEQGNLKVEIYFYPSRPAETIVILVGQRASGATATER